MSGQLVGEVLDAAAALKARGLSERGFHALIAIAEKSHAQSRQGSVPWSHIRAGLYGASLSTAKRAVRDAKTAGVLRVVKRGFDNHAGRVCAPIYEIQPLGERVTQVTQSPDSERVKPGGRTGQIGGRTGHPGDLLNGSINGSTNGGARASAAPPSPLKSQKKKNNPNRSTPTPNPNRTATNTCRTAPLRVATAASTPEKNTRTGRNANTNAPADPRGPTAQNAAATTGSSHQTANPSTPVSSATTGRPRDELPIRSHATATL